MEPSKKYNQYLVRHADYSSNDGFHSKKNSYASRHPPSEADKDSNQNPLEDRMQRAVRDKYYIKDPEQVEALRLKNKKLKEKRMLEL